MAFCSKCGHNLREGARFCDYCGFEVQSQSNNIRKTVFEGKIYKCPNCGEHLKSFVSVCPTCGFEIRGSLATESVSALSKKLEEAETTDQKASIIRHFPIPNTYEDIQEFYILASSNADAKTNSEISSAWISKLEQTMQKARLIIQEQNELERIENQYLEIKKRLNREEKIKKAKYYGSLFTDITPVLPQVILEAGWLISIFILLPLCRKDLDNVGFNVSQLLIMIDLIAGAFFMPFVLRTKSTLPKLIVSSGIILSLILLIPLCTKDVDIVGFNAYQLILIVEIICSVAIVIRTIKYDKEQQNTISLPNSTQLIITLICLLIFIIVYGITSISIPKPSYESSQSPVISKDVQTDTSKGIYSFEIRNYVGKNLASVGKIHGKSLIDEYGYGNVKIVLVTENGFLVPYNDEELKRQYMVIAQSINPGSTITVVHERDNNGKPYSNLVDYQSYDEIVLYIAPVGSQSNIPDNKQPEPTLDRHIYHIRNYVGRNAASFGSNNSSSRLDEYGPAKIKLVFTTEDGSFVNSSDINTLKNYIVIDQDVPFNTELKIQYQTDDRGREYDYLIAYQSCEEINLTVRLLDESITSNMSVIEEDNKTSDNKEYTHMTIKYRVLSNGKAEISGFSGEGNYAEIKSKVDGHEVIGIGANAFKDCDTLESVLFWADVEYINDYAFAGCTSLTEISIPNETTYIGKYAFDGCTELTDLVLWGNPEIDDYAFHDCTSITYVSFSHGTKRVGKHAFDGCIKLESVIVWDDNTIIEKDAFANCPMLKDRPIQD